MMLLVDLTNESLAMRCRSLLVFLLLLTAHAAFAQLPLVQTVPLPMESPKTVVNQTIGLTHIEIQYSRPAVKNREIWGGLVPYNKGVPYPWRAGANENTVISFSTPVKIEGRDLHAGKYGLHMIPDADSCTIIFSGNSTSWGSFSYRASEDVLRIKVANRVSPMHETLTYDFDKFTDSSAEISLGWEKRAIPFGIETDTRGQMLDHIHNTLRSFTGFSWAGWHSAAEYCLTMNYNLPEALIWIKRSIAMDDNFTNNKTKADILRKMERLPEADSAWAKALQIATYSDLNRNLAVSNALKQWTLGSDVLQAIESRFAPTFQNYYTGGLIQKNLKNKDKAIIYFNKALGLAKREEDKKRVGDQLHSL
jgi:hypothetical protein